MNKWKLNMLRVFRNILNKMTEIFDVRVLSFPSVQSKLKTSRDDMMQRARHLAALCLTAWAVSSYQPAWLAEGHSTFLSLSLSAKPKD